jgi:hypothetical protein
MGQSLTDIAQSIKDNANKVQLIYAFNGIAKTTLVRVCNACRYKAVTRVNS